MALLLPPAHRAAPLLRSGPSLPRFALAFRVSVCVWVALLLLVAIPARAWSLTSGDLYRQAKGATVLIVGINQDSHALSFGSEVFISEQVVMTNAHVVED